MISQVLINGEPSDGRIPVTDSSVLRGDGCFEVLRTYSGRTFAIDDHLDRLDRSAAALGIGLPPRDELASWIDKIASELVDGAVRVVVTRGASVPGLDDPSLVVVFGHTWEFGDAPGRLLPVVAPWHAAGARWELAGAKVTSYAPNMSATRRAKAEGYTDAVLVTVGGIVLEGPTFSVAWVADGALETPGLDLGILDSITRRHVMGLARAFDIAVVEGAWNLERLDDATEVMALSTIREVQPVVEVGARTWNPGPVTAQLAEGFEGLINREP
ncbi:MAG TPA: aminotransferase class IV [Acidimicrobiia bacterium]|jgi:branched-chain amino acid aminotransferase